MLTKGKKVIKEHPTFGIVGLSAPDAKWHPDLYQAGINALNIRGIQTVEGRNLHGSYFYLTAEAEEIAKGLHEMFLREDVDVIMCAGGGVCMNKVLPFIDYKLIRENAKPFIGISNIVALMAAMLQHDFVSFHGPFSIWSYGLPGTPTDYTHNNMINALRGYVGNLPAASAWKCYREGEAEGELIGGNIWTLGTVVGTKFCPTELFEGKILLLEDIGKTYDRIDATLTHMELLGIFEVIKGVVVGKLNDCNAPENVKMGTKDLLDMTFGKYSFPVIYECDFGHVPDNLCLPFGCKAKMIASEKSRLILEESGVD